YPPLTTIRQPMLEMGASSVKMLIKIIEEGEFNQRIEVFGSEGCVMVGNLRSTEVTVNGAQDTKSNKPLYFFIERYKQAYLDEMEEFIKCIKENKEPSVGGFDGKISVQMGYAAKESLTKGNFIKLVK
ncbi:unnamed protein product, partial [marine sediment metagenome]